MNGKRRCPYDQVAPSAPLSTGDAAIVLRCTRRIVQLLAAAGELVGEPTWGGQWIFRKCDVEAFRHRKGGRVMPEPGVVTKARPQQSLRFPRPRRTRPAPWTHAPGFRPVMLRAGLKAKGSDPKCDPNRASNARGKRYVA